MHKGDLLVATSGRSFWILDDLAVLTQYKNKKEGLHIFTPEPAVNGSWYSPLSGNTATFNGTDPFEGVNPANGVVLYYTLPKIHDSIPIRMEIRDEKGEVIRTFTSEKDKKYVPNDGGGPPPAPVLSKNEGLNRFVWDMRHPIMPGIPTTYIEASFRGHVVPPGTYQITLEQQGTTVATQAVILPNPTFSLASGQYEEYDRFMTQMEATLTEMHHMVNTLKDAQEQIAGIVSLLKETNENKSLIASGTELLNQLKAWDEDMIQRKSQAYDDVENFPNKFSAEYLFLINHTESSLPSVNTPSKQRRAELDAQWAVLKARGNALLKTSIPAYNEELWRAGIGAVRLK